MKNISILVLILLGITNIKAQNISRESDFNFDGDAHGSGLAVLANEFGRRDCSLYYACEAELDGNQAKENQ